MTDSRTKYFRNLLRGYGCAKVEAHNGEIRVGDRIRLHSEVHPEARAKGTGTIFEIWEAPMKRAWALVKIDSKLPPRNGVGMFTMDEIEKVEVKQ